MPHTTENTVVLPVPNGYLMVSPQEIVRCEAAGNYTHVFLTGERKVTLCKRLKDFEASLPAGTFFRVHHSWLVNLSHVRMWLTEAGDSLCLSDGARVGVARGRKKGLRERLMGVKR
jgi:two-component system LytT family response regulator